jgi:hypothetical protein
MPVVHASDTSSGPWPWSMVHSLVPGLWPMVSGLVSPGTDGRTNPARLLATRTLHRLSESDRNSHVPRRAAVGPNSDSDQSESTTLEWARGGQIMTQISRSGHVLMTWGGHGWLRDEATPDPLIE